MTGVSIKIEDGEVRAAVGRLADNLDRKAAVLDAVGAAALKDTQDNFEAEADPFGVPWTPLSRRTRARRGAEAKILRDQLRLYRSLTYAVSGDSVEVGTNTVYAGAHQFGATIERAPTQQVVHFRFAKVGAGKDGKGSRLRFAKRSTRASGAYAQKVAVGAYRISIPARQFLGAGPRLVARITETLTEAVAP